VALWISAFDINYALMDKDVDREQGIKSFPASYGDLATRNLSIALTIGWMVCFLLTGMHEFTETRRFRHSLWIVSVIAMALANIFVMAKSSESASESEESMEMYQKILFRSSMMTGWVLLGSMAYVDYFSDGLLD